MADLPRYMAQPNVPSLQLPRVSPAAYGAGVFHNLAQLADDMRAKQKPIDAARFSSDYDIQMNDLMNEVEATGDPNTMRERFMQAEQQKRAAILAQIGDPETQRAVNIHADRAYGVNIRNLTERQIKASHQKQLGDIEQVGATLAKTAGETDDPNIRQAAQNTYNAMINTASSPTVIGGRPVPATITPKQAEEHRAEFQKNILRNRALFLKEANPYKLRDEINSGIYKSLPLDEQAVAMEAARVGISNREATVDRNAAKNRTIIMEEARAKAAWGLLSDSFLEAVISRQDPYLTPEDGLHLKTLNENPPMGTGSSSVRAIMSRYYLSGGRTMASIAKARAELNALQATMSNPNPLISKAANELQSDQTAVENLDAARINRTMQAAHDEYDAAVQPMMPFLRNLIPNQRQQDLGKIDTEIRKGGDYKPMVKQKADAQKGRVDSMPQKYKDVQEYGPQR